MGVPNERFREGNVYILYDYDKVMFRYDHSREKCFRKFAGESKEKEVQNDNKLLNDAIRFGEEIDEDEYKEIDDEPSDDDPSSYQDGDASDDSDDDEINRKNKYNMEDGPGLLPEKAESEKSRHSRFLKVPDHEFLTADQVGVILADQWANKKQNITPQYMIDKWVTSSQFNLMKIPLWTVRQFKVIPSNKHSYSTGPIIVDVIKQPIKERHGAFLSSPNMIVIDGKHRCFDAIERGDTHIMAYVGDIVRAEMSRRIFTLSAPREQFATLLDGYYRNPNPLTWGPLAIVAKACRLSFRKILIIKEEYKKGNVFNMMNGKYEKV